MRKILPCIVFLFSLVMLEANAQDRTVSGTVTDKRDGTPISGVSVVVKGTKVATQTNPLGKYTLSVPAGQQSLTFSFIGYVAQTVPVNKVSIDVMLQDDAKQLSEVVVTGYATQNKREVTGSIATLQSAEFSQVPIASFDQALQGKVPGILVQAQSGQPGAAAAVLIRGRGSVLGSNAPLYVVDGVEITSGDFSTLNSQDFESISVLKDASAISIYGSRGANGVIVINSKKGKAGKAKLSYNGQTGYSKFPTNKLVLMTTDQKLDYEIANGNPNGWTVQEIADLRKVHTDWEDVFFQTGRTQEHNLNVSGATDKTNYFLSGGIFDQTGTVKTTHLKRYTGRANVSSGSGDFSYGLNSSFGYSDFTNTGENNSTISTPLNAIRWSNPYLAPYDANGAYSQNPTGQPNPLPELLENKNKRGQLKGIGNAFAAYSAPFLAGLTLKTSWGGDYVSNETFTFSDPTTAAGRAATGGKGSVGRGYARTFRYTGTTSLNYSTNFGADHRLSVGLFNEVIKSKNRSLAFTGYGLGGAFENESGITPGTTTNGFIPAVTGNGTLNSLLSYFTDVHYGFKNRYFLNIGARRDGSSRFGANHKYANFGSVGASWIVSDESFMSGLKDKIFNELKLKASYGSAGNQAGINDFQSREIYAKSFYNGVSGLVQTQLENPNLQWERKTIFNAGIEFTSFNGRLGATVEYYNSLTSDLFLNRQLSRTTGYTSLNSNIGELQNRGIEASLNGTLLKSKDFTWSANVSFTHNQNKVKKLVGDQTEIIGGLTINRIGESINSIYLVRYVGVNPANGNAQYLTKDGAVTETYSATDRVIVGTYETPYFGGFGSSISFKGLEASAFFSYVKGNSIFNNDRFNVEEPTYVPDNLSAELLTEWRKAGDITRIPRSSQPMQSNTTRFVEKGDFLRLRNVDLAYSLPKKWLAPAKLSGAKLFVQGQNLVTWSKFLGFDPEISSGSLTGAQYPALRTVTFGLNVVL